MVPAGADNLADIQPLTSALIEHENPYKPFLPLLKQSNNPEDPIPLLTSSVLSSLISNALVGQKKSNPPLEEALPKLYSYLSSLAKSSDAGLQDIAVQEYSAVLRTSKSRQLFWKQRKETLDPLMDILRTAAGSNTRDNDSTLYSGGASIRSATEVGIGGGVGLQLLYHVLLVVWQLSFEGKLIGDKLNEYADPPSSNLNPMLTRVPTVNTTSSPSTAPSSASRPKRKQRASSSPPYTTCSPQTGRPSSPPLLSHAFPPSSPTFSPAISQTPTSSKTSALLTRC